MSEERGIILYNNLIESRTNLVQFYESNTPIRYDIATGLAYYDLNGIIQERVKFVEQFDEFGNLIVNLEGVPILKKIIDFEAISIFNKNEGVVSGSMYDALFLKGSNKVVQLYSNDKCIEWGMVILGETECLLRIMDNINFLPRNLFPLFQTSELNNNIYNESSRGLVHSLTGKVELYSLYERGKYKSYNYKGDADFLNNPISLWSQKDRTGMSTSTLGSNSFIRMFGKNQIIDLNGKEIGIHECTNIVAGFASIITLSDGHFNAITKKSCSNCFIYSSVLGGIISRSNHFGIIGHRCNRILIEGFDIGKDDAIAKNKGPYFGGIIFNDSNSIVSKSINLRQINHNITRSSLGLSWYSDLTSTEILFGKNIRVEDWDIYSTFLPWLKWDNISSLDKNIYNNGKKTIYPIMKSIDELSIVIGLEGANLVYEYLRDAQEAYRASSKNADDHGIQIDTIHGRNFEPLINDEVVLGTQVARTTNLVVANALNREFMNLYADSTVYGFRSGKTESGTKNLAKNLVVNPNTDIYVFDSVFNEFSVSLMESISLLNNFGLMDALNGQSLRPFGYSNNRNPSAGIAASSMLINPNYIATIFNAINPSLSAPPSLPYTIKSDDEYALDTTRLAYQNLDEIKKVNWIKPENLHGLYKGNDILENSLTTITAIGILQKYFPDSINFLKGLNNSNLDIGILAWRKSMMNSINACSASNIGLNGGFRGDISDYNLNQSTPNTEFNGEIYPWYVSKYTTNIVKYNVLLEILNNQYILTFIDSFSNLKLKENFNIEINDILYNSNVISIISSSKIIIEPINVLFTTPLTTKIYQYVGLRKDNTYTPSVIIDKDSDYFNALNKTEHLRETVTNPYIASKIPNPSNLLYRFKIKMINENIPEEGSLLYLVKTDDFNIDHIVTYRECAEMLGFDTIGKQFINLDLEVMYQLSHNLDGQNHIHKGVFGIRMDNVQFGASINNTMTQIESNGFSPETNLIGNKTLLTNLDIIQDLRPGTRVNDVHGVSINGCTDISIRNNTIDLVQTLGNIYGVQIYGESKNIEIKEITANNLNAGFIYGNTLLTDPFNLSKRNFYYSNYTPPDSHGINVDKTCTNINIDTLTINGLNITSPSPDLAKLIEISKQ